MSNQLAAAAQAVIDRWNCPKWEWHKQGPTADLIHALRQSLAAHEAAKPSPNAWRCAKCEHLYEEKVTLCDCMPEKQDWLPAFVSDAAPSPEAVPVSPTTPNLACKSAQKRLAAQWGYVPAPEADALAKANEARRYAQSEVAHLKAQLAGARLKLMRELREQGWAPPAPAQAQPVGCSYCQHPLLAAHEAAKPAEPVAWRLKSPPGSTYTAVFNPGQPDDQTRQYWERQGCEFEYAYAAPVAVASWQPIESAPKDGEVLVYVTETDEQFVAYWDEGWRFSRNAKLKSPTHWMPLPPAPKEKQHE